MKKINQDESGLAAAMEPTIKRSRAAELLDKTPRTLARYESLGILRPIKLNSRSVVYRVSDIQKILNGNIPTVSASANSFLLSRSKRRVFTPVFQVDPGNSSVKAKAEP